MGNLSTCAGGSYEQQLVEAVRMDNMEDVREILSYRSANLDELIDGHTALYTACVNNRWEMVSLLLKERADVNVISKMTDLGVAHSPLYGACLMGNIKCVNALIEHGKDIDMNRGSFKTRKGNKFVPDETPLFICCRKGFNKIVKILLLQDSINPNILHPKYGSCVRVAMKFRKIECFDVLVRNRKVDICADENKFKDPILTEMAKKEYPTKFFKILLNKRPDLDFRGDKSANPLIGAIRHRNYDVIKLLLAHKNIDVNGKGIDSRTPLIFCCSELKKECNRNRLILRAFLNHPDIDVNLDDRYHGSPLYVAAKNDLLYVVEEIIASPKGRQGGLNIEYRSQKENLRPILEATTNEAIKKKIRRYSEFLKKQKEKE